MSGGEGGNGTTGVPTPMVEAATRHWIGTLVVGLGLCPFAGPALARDLVRLAVVESEDTAEILARLAAAASELLDADEPDATTLLVLPRGVGEFDDYLDLLALAEALLEELGHEGALQLASFHPDYRFEGSEEEDVANATNRSPFPMLQLLQEPSVTRAVDAHPDPEGIPERNVEKMRSIGAAGLRALLAPRGGDATLH